MLNTLSECLRNLPFFWSTFKYDSICSALCLERILYLAYLLLLVLLLLLTYWSISVVRLAAKFNRQCQTLWSTTMVSIIRTNATVLWQTPGTRLRKGSDNIFPCIQSMHCIYMFYCYFYLLNGCPVLRWLIESWKYVGFFKCAW